MLVKAEIFRPLEPDLVKTNVGKWQINDYQGRFATFFCISAYFFAIYHLYYGGKIMTMTQMQSARAGKITDEMKIVAQEEKMNIETLRERVANGTIAICANINHQNLHYLWCR